MIPVYSGEFSGLTSPFKKTMDSQKIMVEGIYIFGGIKDSGEMTNQLAIVDTCKSV